MAVINTETQPAPLSSMVHIASRLLWRPQTGWRIMDFFFVNLVLSFCDLINGKICQGNTGSQLYGYYIVWPCHITHESSSFLGVLGVVGLTPWYSREDYETEVHCRAVGNCLLTTRGMLVLILGVINRKWLFWIICLCERHLSCGVWLGVIRFRQVAHWQFKVLPEVMG